MKKDILVAKPIVPNAADRSCGKEVTITNYIYKNNRMLKTSKETKAMKFTVLIDNHPHPEKTLHTEHGLSIYFEQDNLKWLLDTGNSPLFIENAKALSIDVNEIDYVILSHGHKDHTGGLEAFLENNQKAKVFLSASIAGNSYYSFRQQNKHDITIDKDVVQRYKHRIEWITTDKYLSENVAVITHFPHNHSMPLANKTLYNETENQLIPDNFNHELALSVKTNQGMVVFSGCAHNGLLNTLEACVAFTGETQVSACVGGAHLPDKSDTNAFESDAEIYAIAEILNNQFKGIKLITGHCTGRHAQRLLKQRMVANMDVFYSGYMLDYTNPYTTETS
jgi:7,8-dihydropterin-6-yl-methyl-4-(beta-D-ribofuranosyl)aminobenzene 5'-phosphate synthase